MLKNWVLDLKKKGWHWQNVLSRSVSVLEEERMCKFVAIASTKPF